MAETSGRRNHSPNQELAELMARRVLYQPITDPDVDPMPGGRRFVAGANFTLGADFPLNVVSHSNSDMLPASAGLYQMFMNISAYLCGNKPNGKLLARSAEGRAVVAAIQRMGGRVEDEWLVREGDHLAVGRRIWITTRQHVSLNLIRVYRRIALNMPALAKKRSGGGPAPGGLQRGQPRRRVDPPDDIDPLAPRNEEEALAEVDARLSQAMAEAAGESFDGAEEALEGGEGGNDDTYSLTGAELEGYNQVLGVPRYHNNLRLALHMHASECIFVRDKLDKLGDKRAREIFGNPKRRGLVSEFKFLNVQTLEQQTWGHFAHYYQEARVLQPERMRQVQEDDQQGAHEDLWRTGFRPADLFIYHVNLPASRRPCLAQLTPSNYFRGRFPTVRPPMPRIDMENGSDDAVSNEEWKNWADLISRDAQDLCMLDGPAPDHFPFPEYVVRVKQSFVLAELLSSRPLPFPIGLVADTKRLVLPHTELEKEIPHLLLAVHDRRTTYTNNNVLAEEEEAEEAEAAQRREQEERDRLNVLLSNNPEQEMREGNIPLAQPGLVDAYLRHTRSQEDARVDWLRQHPGRMVDYLGTRQNNVRVDLMGLASNYKDQSYPGMLSVPKNTDSQRHRQQMTEMAILDMGLDIDRLEAGAYNLANRVELANQQLGDKQLPDMEQIREGLERLNHMGAPAFPRGENGEYGGADNEEMEAYEADMWERVLQARPNAGRWGTLPVEAIRQDDFLKMRIINTARYVEFDKQNPDPSAPGFDDKLHDLQKRCLTESIHCHNITRLKSRCWLSARTSGVRYREAGGKTVFPLQPTYNSSSFDSMIVWMVNSLVQLFQVAPRTLFICLMANIFAFSVYHEPYPGTGEPSLSILSEGPGGVGKSFAWKTVIQLHLPGIVVSLNDITPKAFMSGQNLGNMIIIQEEVSTAMFIDPADAANKKVTSSMGGNSQLVATMKSLLTDKIMTSMATFIDKETGERSTRLFQSYCNGVVLMVASNLSSDYFASPLLRRFTRVEMRTPMMDSAMADDAMSQFRLQSVSSAAVLHEFTTQWHLMDMGIQFVEAILSQGALYHSDVSTDVATFLTDATMKRLSEEFHLPKADLTITMRSNIIKTARTCAVAHALFRLFATEEGHTYQAHARVNYLSEEAVLDFIAPHLTVLVAHVVFAWSIMGEQIVKAFDTDIMVLLSHLMRFGPSPGNGQPESPAGIPQKKHYWEPLSVYANEMVGDTKIQLELGLRRNMGPPNIPIREDMLAMAAMDHTIVHDHRYVRIVGKNVHEIAEKVHKQFSNLLRYEIRVETIRGRLLDKRDQMVRSPYYQKDPVTGKIEPMRLPDGTIPMDNIPCLMVMSNPHGESNEEHGAEVGGRSGRGRGGRNATQVAVALVFFRQRHHLVACDYDAEMIINDIGHHMQTELQKEELEKRLRQQPIERLKLPVFAREDLNKDWVDRWSLCNGHSPVHMALRSVLRDANLGHLPSDTEEEDVANAVERSGQGNRVYKFITYSIPQPIKVKIMVNGQSQGDTIITFPHCLQLLEVRSGNGNLPLTFINNSRASASARLQLQTLLPKAVGPVPHNHVMAFINSMGTYLDADPDYIVCQRQWEILGRPRSSYFERLGRSVHLPPETIWFWPPNEAKINAHLRAALHTTDMEGEYPNMDISNRIEQSFQIWQDTHRSHADKFKHLQPASRLLLWHPRLPTAPGAAPSVDELDILEARDADAQRTMPPPMPLARSAVVPEKEMTLRVRQVAQALHRPPTALGAFRIGLRPRKPSHDSDAMDLDDYEDDSGVSR